MDTAVNDPRIIDLKSAVSEISQACEGALRPYQTPFFLILGAGASAPAIPLARSIVEECQSIAKRYGRVSAPAGGGTLDEYSHWFSRAYPGARQRQQYLRALIERKPLSLASLRIAHLLSAPKLTNLVITTNFDDFIARALRLFGQEPAVCDHPRTVGRIDRERDDIQIVHVHGSYLFYDCANLRAEVNGRARTDEETSFTMVGLLDSLLWTRSPLVIGYSGWEGDVIMSALNRRLRGGNPLAHSIYWFCYRRAERDNLPKWLRDSNDVRFVVPPEPAPPEPVDPSGRRASRSVEEVPEPVLRAVEVFDELNQKFDIGPPKLFQNPLEYLASSLEMSLPETEATAGDPYAFKALIERLRRAADAFSRSTAPKGLQATLDRLRELMRESQYPEAVDILANIVPAKLARLDQDAKKEVMAAARLAGTALLAKLGEAPPSPNLASILVFDSKIDELFAKGRDGLSWLVGSRSGQFGFETSHEGKPHGAFTVQLTQCVRDAACDVDGDGRVSLLEATVEASRRMTANPAAAPYQKGLLQTPVAGGRAAEVALFTSRTLPASEREQGALHALLVGAGKLKIKDFELGGPVNDVALFAKLLRQKPRRLFSRVEVHPLADQMATRARVMAALDGVLRKARPQDVILFYFSGRGFRTDDYAAKSVKGGRRKPAAPTREAGVKVDVAPEFSLVMHDFDQKDRGVITQIELLAAFNECKAERQVIILDL